MYDSIYYKALVEFPDCDLNETMKKYWISFLRGYSQTSPLEEINILALKRLFLLREAVLYVHYYRTVGQERMDTEFFRAQNQKIKNIAVQTHQVDFEFLSMDEKHIKTVLSTSRAASSPR